MDLKALHMLWLVPVFTLTAQGLDLSVSPGITARCGSHVRLQCMATSSRSGLSIKHIGWYHRNTPVCYVDNQGPILFNQTDHYCEYEDGQLSLTFPKLKPYQEGRDLESYLCKLRSNQEVKHKYTSVELDDCAAAVTGVLTTAGPSCTFYNVYPDGEVHWFRSSNDVWVEPSNSKHLTTKRVETGGYLTIQSNLTLLETVSGVVFNCSLKSSRSGKYIASTLIRSEGLEGRGGARMAPQFKNTAVRSQEVVTKALYVSVILAVLKIIS
ncbi:uncharacterized protein LOC103383577 [Cynoglossus semilaevis]|uniref:uncharacterized protein LOC103383577 n=1 Tax=Cynoglossus semilaevis TaxID=244447 RepID=UPI0004953E27|nr:uncharacterized protein LOC103383577 [Cynoglossus semilaevis]XP_024914687.1 uncharacterized protein LOC103383577 [Cynoglossus semilaevis]